MATQWKEDFAKILLKMVSRKDSEFFRDPVDWEALGLFDYPQVIKKPMDLGSVKTNFDNGLYNNPAEAASDVRLVFSNAMTYNDPRSKVYQNARSLGEFFEAQWSQVVKSEHDIDRPPSVEALTEFVEKCHRMTPEDLGKTLKVLDKACPQCLVKKPDANEVEINTDLINGKAFHEVNEFIDSLVTDLKSRRTKK